MDGKRSTKECPRCGTLNEETRLLCVRCDFDFEHMQMVIETPEERRHRLATKMWTPDDYKNTGRAEQHATSQRDRSTAAGEGPRARPVPWPLVIGASILILVGIGILAFAFATAASVKSTDRDVAGFVIIVTYLGYVFGLMFFVAGVKVEVDVLVAVGKLTEAILVLPLCFLAVLVAPLSESKFLALLAEPGTFHFQVIRFPFIIFVVGWIYGAYYASEALRRYRKSKQDTHR